jgi:hypothetical protein
MARRNWKKLAETFKTHWMMMTLLDHARTNGPAIWETVKSGVKLLFETLV